MATIINIRKIMNDKLKENKDSMLETARKKVH
jgi:hypothetical protein